MRTVDVDTRQPLPENADGFSGAVVEVADTIKEVLRAPDTTMRALQAMTGRVAGAPFTLLAGHESMPSMLSTAWITTSAELIDMAVSAQRRTVDRTVAVQRQLIDGFVDTGSILAGMAGAAASGPPAGGSGSG